MSTLVTNAAPDFTATAVMPDNSFNEEFSLSSFRGKHVVLFFYPLDFTFVCPSEIIAFDKALAEFKARNCEVIGVSVDSHFTHLAWKNTEVNQGGIGNIQYPLVADLNKQIARDYGVLFGESVALRGLFLIDKEGIVHIAFLNRKNTGSNPYCIFYLKLKTGLHIWFSYAFKSLSGSLPCLQTILSCSL